MLKYVYDYPASDYLENSEGKVLAYIDCREEYVEELKQIIESANKSLELKNENKRIKEALERFCAISKSDFPATLNYWVGFFEKVILSES